MTFSCPPRLIRQVPVAQNKADTSHHSTSQTKEKWYRNRGRTRTLMWKQAVLKKENKERGRIKGKYIFHLSENIFNLTAYALLSFQLLLTFWVFRIMLIPSFPQRTACCQTTMHLQTLFQSFCLRIYTVLNVICILPVLDHQSPHISICF